MTWNYRVIKIGEEVGIHEVYYDEEGNPSSYTANPVAVSSYTEDGADSLKWILERMLEGVCKEVLSEEDFTVPK
jgi:hypothetical protein